MSRGPSTSAALAAIVLASTTLVSGCVRVYTSYRDVGTDGPARDATDAGDAPRVSLGADATRAVLRSIGERVIFPSLVDFEVDAAALELATEALRVDGSSTNVDAARAAWRSAMARWQRLEMLQVGPAGLPGVTPGGRGLRDEIDAWPLVNRCRIDQETVESAHDDPTAFASEAVNVRGLAAMEYLLFHAEPDNGCTATHVINATGAWAALTPEEIAHQRAAYAHTLAVLVHARAIELRLAWDPAGGDFLTQLSTAGAGSSVFVSAQSGLNGVSDALFYLYKELTDSKLGVPAGLRVDCATDTCPGSVESLWAGASLDHLRANLEAFRDAYLGGPPDVSDAPGLDDLLRSVGADALDDQVQAGIARCLAALDAVTPPLEAALVTDYADVVALHDAFRDLGTLHKVDVLTLLDLELPTRVEGDND